MPTEQQKIDALVKSLFQEINSLCQGQRVDIAAYALAYEFAMILGKSVRKSSTSKRWMIARHYGLV